MEQTENEKLDFVTCSLIKLKLKPAMKKSFNFIDIYNCSFNGNYKDDTLIVTGWGKLSDESEVEITSVPKKLSENIDSVNLFTDLAVKKLKERGVIIKELWKSKLLIDFLKKELSTTLFFLDSNNEKIKQTISINF